MEGVVLERWEEEEVATENSLRGRRPRQQESNITVSTTTTNDTEDVSDSSSSGSSNEAEPIINQELNVKLERTGSLFDKDGGSESSNFVITIPEIKSLPSESIVPLSKHALEGINVHIPSANQGTAEHGNSSPLLKESTQDTTEFYLERVIEKPVTHDFYCPNCNSCIRKVILRGSGPVQPPEPDDHSFICTSCLSFLIPVGTWFFRNWADNDEGTRNKQGGTLHDQKVNDEHQKADRKKASGNQAEPDGRGMSVAPAEDKKTDKKDTPGFVIDIVPADVIKENPTDEPKKSDKEADEVTPPESTPAIPCSTDETLTVSESFGADKLEIIKSIVYGGLTESITSLSVVTSAASADAATLNIIALALANLISGLFVIGNNLLELRKEQPGGDSNQANEQVDRCQELLGQRKNFILHSTIAVLSFLAFGLVPPLVYGFSFRKSDNKDYKLAAVAAASLLCITILAIGKAYTQKPPKHYIKTLLSYVVVGFTASGVSYAAGDLIKKLIEKLGWFQSKADVMVSLAEMSSAGRPAWASY